MSLTTAKDAIRDYFGHPQCNGIVTFYGGEPLLEFDLLKQAVLFAEETGHQTGINPDFQVTTNGTLLTDDRIRFLVDHDIFVTVSLDGNKRRMTGTAFFEVSKERNEGWGHSMS